MANPAATHYSNLAGKIVERTSHPSNPKTGEFYVNSDTNYIHVYDGSHWYGEELTTTTSTSSSTTTTSTSTSTTTTSTSTTTSVTTSTSSSTSTTTT